MASDTNLNTWRTDYSKEDFKAASSGLLGSGLVRETAMDLF